MSDQRLVFEQSIEGMYLKGHSEKLTPEVVQALRRVGIDLEAPLKSAYPVEVANEATRLFRQLAYAQVPSDADAYALMGERILDGYVSTIYGKALITVLRLFPTRVLIDRLPQAMRSGDNFTEVQTKWLGPAELELTLTGAEPDPHLKLGVIRRAFVHWFKTPGFEISLASCSGGRATYHLKWLGGAP